jgi:hypothetical protein
MKIHKGVPKGKVINQEALFSSQAASKVREDFYKSIARWLTDEVRKGSAAVEDPERPNLLGLAVLFTDELLHITRVNGKILVEHPEIRECAQAVYKYVTDAYDEIDKSLQRRHRGFKRDLEDLDFSSVKDKSIFQGYLQELAHSEELYFIARKVKHIAETLSEIEQSHLDGKAES